MNRIIRFSTFEFNYFEGGLPSQQPASENCNILSNQLIDEKQALIHQQIQLLEYGKNTLDHLKQYIKENSFIENQHNIEEMIENLYQLSKQAKAQ